MKLNLKISFIFFIFSLLTALFFYAYSPAIHGKYFGDDYGFLFTPYNNSIFHIFIDKNLASFAYRPIEKLFLLTIQNHFEYQTIAIHLTQMILHFLFSIIFYVWLRKQGFSKTSSIFAFSYMLLTQAASHAVSSNDTFSQITSTIFGYTSVALLTIAFKNNSNRNFFFYYSSSFFLFIFSIISKETGLSFFPFICFILFCHIFKNALFPKRWFITITSYLIPFIIITSLYFILRKYINLDPATFGDGRYNVNLGLNIIINFVQAIFLALLPFSSVDFYFSLQSGNISFLLISILFVSILTIVILLPILSKAKRNLTILTLLLLPVSLFPVIILNHISELYVYNTIPLIVILLANSIEYLKVKYNKVFTSVLPIFLFSVFLINVHSVKSKSILVKTNGINAEQMLNKIKPYLPEIPTNGTLFLVNTPYSQKTEYSIFKFTEFRLFECGEHIFNRISGRNDFKVKIVQKNQFNCDSLSGGLYLLVDNNNQIQRTTCQ